MKSPASSRRRSGTASSRPPRKSSGLALQIRFFMAEADQRDLLRRLEQQHLQPWPGLREPGDQAPFITGSVILQQAAYYLAAGDVTRYPIQKGPQRGRRA